MFNLRPLIWNRIESQIKIKRIFLPSGNKLITIFTASIDAVFFMSINN
jgi:hypothetical protein